MGEPRILLRTSTTGVSYFVIMQQAVNHSNVVVV